MKQTLLEERMKQTLATDLAKQAGLEGIGTVTDLVAKLLGSDLTGRAAIDAAWADINATQAAIDAAWADINAAQAAIDAVTRAGKYTSAWAGINLAELMRSNMATSPYGEHADTFAKYGAKLPAQVQQIQEEAHKERVRAIARDVLRALLRGLSRELSRDDDSALRSSPRDEII